MDPKRFDALSRMLARGFSRRQALSRAGVAGVLAGVGHGSAALALPAAQDETCQLSVVATVRVGPSSTLTFGGDTPGELRGDISFSLGPDGAIDDGRLQLASGQELAVVGQATGRAVDLRIEAGIGQVLVFTGTAQRPLDRCRGAVDGLFTGPQTGDLGDWHATATALAGGGGGGQSAPATTPAPNVPTATPTPAPIPTATTTPPPAATATLPPVATATPPPATATPPPAETPTPVPTETPTPPPTETPTPEPPTPTPEPPTPTPVPCPSGTTDCGGLCVDLQTDVNNCGSCGNVCPPGQPGFVPGCAEGNCFFMRERACQEGLASCNGVCVDVQTDPANCGACGNACGSGEVCFGGLCAREHRCDSPLVECGGVCVDVTSDATNCGACGNACGEGEICFGGACAREHR